MDIQKKMSELKQKRVQLSDDALEAVTGGTAYETFALIHEMKENGMTMDEAVDFANQVFSDFGDAGFEELFGGDRLDDVLQFIGKCYGTKLGFSPKTEFLAKN